MSALMRQLELRTLIEREQRLAATRGADLPTPAIGRPTKARGPDREQRTTEARRALMVALFAGDVAAARQAALSIPGGRVDRVRLSIERCGLRWPL